MAEYPYWLDGEVLNIGVSERAPWLDGSIARTHPTSGLKARATRHLMKLHALMGAELVVSDQVFDSGGFVQLFEDREFRSFLEGIPGFLRPVLRADGATRTFEKWRSGLQRLLEPTWNSSVLPHRSIDVKRIAEAVLQHGGLDPGRVPFFKAEQRGTPEDIAALGCVIDTLDYLLNSSSVQTGMVSGPTQSYYEVLTQLAEADARSGAGNSPYGEALAFVDGRIEARERKYRAAVRRLLPLNPDDWTTEQRRIWAAVVLAWNRATGSTVARGLDQPQGQPRRESATSLTGIATPGTVLGEILDLIFPPGSVAVDPARIPSSLKDHGIYLSWLDFNVDSLSWARILATRDSMSSFLPQIVEASSEPDLAVHYEAMTEFTRKLAESVDIPGVGRPWIWIGLAATSVGLGFGGEAAAVSGLVLGGVGLVHHAGARLLDKGRRLAIARTLVNELSVVGAKRNAL